MGPELHVIAPEKRQGWAIGRRRKLAAAILGVLMLGMSLDDSGSMAPVSQQEDDVVTVDEFDRIEALLAEAETPKATGRGPTVEVPGDLTMNVERPSFDFAAFDDMHASQSRHTDSSSDESVSNLDATTKPPTRASFDVQPKHPGLKIPEAMALTGQAGGSLPDDVDVQGDNSANSDVGPTMILAGPSSKNSPHPVQIITSDVTASTVTRFDPTDKSPPDEEAGRIRFTGSIFPVSRLGNSR